MADVERDLGRLEGKVDLILSNQKAQAEAQIALNTRVSSLEGKAMAGGAIAGLLSMVAVELGRYFLRKA